MHYLNSFHIARNIKSDNARLPGWLMLDLAEAFQSDITTIRKHKMMTWHLTEFLELLDYKGYGEMPTKKPANKKPTIAKWEGYLNLTLTPEMDDAFDDMYAEDLDIFTPLLTIVAEGYKVSFSKRDSGEFVASMTANWSDMPRAGHTLTAWSADLHEAMALLLYKHIEVLEADWNNAGQKTGKKKRG